MRSGTLLKASAATLLSLLLVSCATTSISNDVPHCEDLIPAFLLQPAEGTDPESKKHADGHEDAQPWIEAWFGDEAVIEKQNDKAPAVDHIYRTCLELHRKALAKSNRGFLGFH